MSKHKGFTLLFKCSTFVDNKYIDIGSKWIINCITELLTFNPTFGFTYEDSNVEKYALKICNNKENGLIILSGGDTMFDIAGMIKNLTAVDMNFGQIELAKEKINCMNNGSYELLLNEIDNKKIIYDDLFCKLKRNLSFDAVFDTNTLIEDFGKNAVENTSCSFSDHFKNVFETHSSHHSWIFDRDFKNKIDKYKNFDLNAINDVNIIHNLFENLLFENKYDFIQTSNITDWMNRTQFVAFCNSLKRSLRGGGVLVMRRLASDNILKDLFPESAEINDDTNIYKETIIWKKNY